MKDILTTFQAARICGVDITSIINWINAGKLKAYKTPGGHRRIRRLDLLDMITRYKLPVPRGFSSVLSSVLLVAADARARAALSRMLCHDNPSVSVWSADNAFLAGKLVAEKKPTVIIVDYDMPGIKWPGISSIIRRDRRLKSTALICLLGASCRIEPEGADACIRRPLRKEAVLSFVERYTAVPVR